MKREAPIYLFLILGLGAAIAYLLQLGSALHHVPAGAATAAPVVTATSSLFDNVAHALQHNALDPVSRLFLQLLVILAASRVVGKIFTWIGQPAVVGEMTAGILLGPSLFGLLAPEAFRFVFAPESLSALKLLSQIGVCLFMFTVGMELDVAQLRNKAHTAVVVSHASIVVPFFLGVLLALGVYRGLAAPTASFTAFALFLGISMSITAFPVLARILQERGMMKSLLGVTAITCAAVDDVTAWSILAFVVAIVRATSMASAAVCLALVLLYVGVMVWFIRPRLAGWLGHAELEKPELSKGLLAVIIGLVIASAYLTEIIGVHALFGAFLAGAIMPAVGDFRHRLAVRVENLSSVLFLPLFFCFTGLRTQLGLLSDTSGWLLCLGIIAIATVGKLGGSAVTARLTGMGWRDSLQLGALMNTRGLMELIVLNIGLDLGVLSPRIFTMMVIMALVTTAMTGPLLTLLQKRRTVVAPEAVPA